MAFLENSGRSALFCAAIHSRCHIRMGMLLIANANVHEKYGESVIPSILEYLILEAVDNNPRTANRYRKKRQDLLLKLTNLINLAYAAGADCPDQAMNEFIHVFGNDEDSKFIIPMNEDKPLALQEICRKMIREHLNELSRSGAYHKNLFVGVSKLPLPNLIKEFLLFGMKPQSPWQPLPDNQVEDPLTSGARTSQTKTTRKRTKTLANSQGAKLKKVCY